MDARPRHFSPVAAGTVEAVLGEVRRHAVRSAHYVGMADEGLIRGLQAELRQGLTIMDYFDRWGGSARFFGDSEGLALPPYPDWMEGVTCYQEGSPEADMLVWDLDNAERRDAELLLRELLEPGRFKHVTLFGPFAKPPLPAASYRWRSLAGAGWGGSRR